MGYKLLPAAVTTGMLHSTVFCFTDVVFSQTQSDREEAEKGNQTEGSELCT